jgi:MFS family permease
MDKGAGGGAPPAQRGDFGKYWTGQTISNLGSSFTQFALPLLVYKLTGSALNLGLTTAVTYLPYVLFGLPIGAWADRANRKRLMIVTDLLRALVIASVPALALLGGLRVEWIYGTAFVSSTLTMCFVSAEFTVIPSLVGQEQLLTANGRIQASYHGAAVLGPLLAGLVVTLLPLPDILFVDAASFVISSLSLAWVRASFNRVDAPVERKPLLRDVAEGLRYVLRHPVLRSISLMVALVNFVGYAASSQLVLFAKQQLAASDAQVALLFTASSAGMVLYALLAGPLRRRLPLGVVTLLCGVACGGLATLVFAFQRSFWVALPIWGIGATGVLLDITMASLRQAVVPHQLLGRVVSIAYVLAYVAIPLGAMGGGLAVQQTGKVVLLFAVVGVLNIATPLLFFTQSPLGHAERYLPSSSGSSSSASVEDVPAEGTSRGRR